MCTHKNCKMSLGKAHVFNFAICVYWWRSISFHRSHSSAVQSCLLGYKFVNIYACFPTETLHQCFNGLGGHHLLGCIELQLDHSLPPAASVRSKALIKERLQYMRHLPGTNIPSQSLETVNITAEASAQSSCQPLFPLPHYHSSANFTHLQWVGICNGYIAVQERRGILKVICFAVNGVLSPDECRLFAGIHLQPFWACYLSKYHVVYLYI